MQDREVSILRPGVVLEEANLLLVVVLSIAFSPRKMGANYLLLGKVEPVALVICRAGGVQAVDMEATEIDLEHLRQDTPGLNDIIVAFLGD